MKQFLQEKSSPKTRKGYPSRFLRSVRYGLVILCVFYAGIIEAQKADVSNFYHHFKTSTAAEEATEEYAAKLDSCHILNTVASKINASVQDMNLFNNYYIDTIYNDRVEYVSELLSTINTDADIHEFANKLITKYVALYEKLQTIKKEYPSTATEYSSPKSYKPQATCNPTCSDIGFEAGNMTGWNAYYASNNSTSTKMTYTAMVGGAAGAVTQAANDIVNCKYHTKPTYQVKIMSGTGNDAIAGPIIPVVAPGGGSYSCRLGDTSVGGSRVAIIDQQFTVTAGNTALNYMYAPVVDMPAYNAPHTWGQQPHFIVTITDQTTGDTLQCGKYLVTSSTTDANYTAIYYTVPAYNWQDTIYVAPWKSVFVSLQNYIGHCIDIQATVSDCYPSAIGPHFCYVYFDATCGPFSIIASTPSVCGGNVNLTAPAGGSAYAWTGPGIVGSSTGQVITASASGTYTVTVTSADGCTDTLQKPVTITPTMSVTATSTNAGCATGTATANPTGGTPPYTYKWSNGSTNQKDTGLAPGNYTCTVTAAGCVETASVTIAGGGITATVSNTNVRCNGALTGTATVTPSGGATPYTYTWNNSSTNQILTGAGAGTYTCNVKDAGGCITTQTVTITQPTAITSTTSFTGTPCGATTGSASVAPSGGTPAYTYAWNTTPAQTNSTASNLGGGSYNVTITDANSCTATATVIVPTTNGPHDSIVSSQNVSCFDGNNGNAVAGAAGGTAPYTYSWTGGQTGTMASSLTAGTYTVTATDNTGCPSTTTVTITQPPALRDSITNSVNVLCFGGNNGSAAVGVKGGIPTYTYVWNTTPAQTTTTATSLTAGTYTVDVTDANGCKDSTTVVIIQPAKIVLTPTVFPASCWYKCDGQAIVVPKGGSNPYTYTWSNGSTGPSVNNLCEGKTYSVTVTDAHGCKQDTSVTVLNPPPIVLTTTSSPSMCSKADGSASVTASGGTPGYTYAWNTTPTQTTTTANNLLPGTYTVIITDANTCEDTTKVVVTNISGDTVKIVSVTNILCNGGNNGSATAAASGGTAPYTYAWSPTGGNTTIASNLIAGNYTISATDKNGCVATAVAKVTQPPPVIVLAQGQTICIGQSATLAANASGGTPTYTYNWTPGGSGQSITVSPTGTTSYTVTATDANGCSSPPVIVTVTVRPPLTVKAGPPASICPGSSATIVAIASGGDSVYYYSWAPDGATTSSIQVSPVVTTTYTVIVSDACGTPVAKDSVTITVLPLPVVNLVADTLQGCYPLCVDFTNKTTVAGGTIATSSWTFGDGTSSTNADPNHCYNEPGVFTVSLTVTSSNGCSASKTINNYITAYSHPVADFSLSPQPTDINNPTIYFTDHSTDAYGIVNWLWQFGDGSDSTGVIKNPQHTYKDTGSYCANLQVINEHGCVADTTECLYIEPFFVIYVPNAFTPNNNGTNDLFTAKGVGILDYNMWIFDRWGQQLYHTTDIYGGWNGIVQNGASGQQAQEDTYVWLIEVTDVFHKNHRYVGKVTLIR